MKNFWHFIIINPLTSPKEGVTVFTSPYLSAGAPALGEVKGLISLPDISKWDISKVKEMDDMFEGCFELLVIPKKLKN